MKKTNCLLMVFAILPVLNSYGVDISLSMGGGGLLGGLFTRYTLTSGGIIELGETVTPVDVVSKQEINQMNYGVHLFFDATWIEFSLGFQGGSNAFREEYSAEAEDGTSVSDSKISGTGIEAMLGFTLLGKYPIHLNERFTLFPLAGVEYQAALLEYRKEGDLMRYSRTNVLWEWDSDGNAYKLSAWNSLLIDIGVGLDFAIDPRVFLRTELLYGFRLQTPYEVDALEKLKKEIQAPSPKLAGLTSGPTLKLALGYRLR
jgi:opacity protein-like surface antigen